MYFEFIYVLGNYVIVSNTSLKNAQFLFLIHFILHLYFYFKNFVIYFLYILFESIKNLGSKNFIHFIIFLFVYEDILFFFILEKFNVLLILFYFWYDYKFLKGTNELSKKD